MDKCEICYEPYDEDENMNKPYCLFPCGHTFWFLLYINHSLI